MSSLFSFRLGSEGWVIRLLTAIVSLIAGWLFYIIISEGLIGVDYTATSYLGVIVQELISTVQPTLLSLVPALFITLSTILSNTSWKKLVLIAIGSGIILTVPPYLYNLLRWQPLLQTIQDLPIYDVGYHRNSACCLSRAEEMWIQIFIPKDHFREVNQTIESRLARNKVKLLKYQLEGISRLTAEYYLRKQTREGTEAVIRVREAFEGYDY